MNAMVLAAGKGTRLSALTETIPKPMLPLAGRPVLAHILAWLRRYGVRQVAINLHHHPESIRNYFGSGSDFAMDIIYSEEPVLLGTAGGVKKMEAFFHDPFVVVYGDVLTDFDLNELLAFHRDHDDKPHATLTLDRRSDFLQCGIVELGERGQVKAFIEKPKAGDVRSPWVNSGIMVLDRALLKMIPADCFWDFGRDAFPDWLSRGLSIYGWQMSEGNFLIDMGTPEKLAQADRELIKRFRVKPS
jgi:NDP-sugar pyrophosphorylase family protein